MPVTEKYDASNQLIEREIKPATYTVSYSRKVPRDGGYGAGEEASIFSQVEVPLDADEAMVEQLIKQTFAFNKAIVLQQLGVTFGVDQETGVVNGLDSAAASAAAAPAAKPTTVNRHNGSGGPVAKSYGDGVKRSKEELIAELQSNPAQFFDNRVDKKNPKGPDFKRKSSGEGLWLSDLESAGVSV